MSKKSKKAKSQKRRRNKAYSGRDAAAKTPVVTKYTAVKKSALQEKLDRYRPIIKPLAITMLVAGAIIWLIFALVAWAF